MAVLPGWLGSLLAFILFCLVLHFVVRKGIPFILSRYITYHFQNPNSKFRIDSLHLFRAILLRKIRIKHNNLAVNVDAIQLVTNMWPIGGDDLYSSLFILKVQGIHLKLLQHNITNEIQGESGSIASKFEKAVGKLISVISSMKFLVTVIVEDSVVVLGNSRVTAKSLKIHPESMRNSLVNLNIEIENAKAEQMETNIALKIDKVVTNSIIQVIPPEIDTFEFIVGEVLLEVPAGVAGRYLDKIKVEKHQAKSTTSSSALPSPASPSQPNSPPNQTKSLLKSLPNVDLQLKRITISVADRDRQALDATMATVNVTFQAPDTLLAVDVESIGVDFRKRFTQKLLDMRTIKARWSPSILSAIFSQLNMKLNIAQAHTGLDMLSHGIPNTQPENNKCTVQLSVLQGTLDRPSSEMTVVQVQSLVSSLDCDDLTSDVTSFDVQDLHCSLDSDKREMYLTSSQMSSYLADQSLRVAFAWKQFAHEFRMRFTSRTLTTKKPKKWTKISFRSANTSMAFVLPNGIELKFCSGPLKVKHRQSWLKACDINDHTFSIKDVHASVYCMKEPSTPSLKRLLQIPSISIHSKRGDLSVKFSESLELYWSTLIHRIFYDLSDLVRNRSENGGESENANLSTLSSDEEHQSTISNVSVVLEKGLNLTAKLQTQTIRAHLASLNFNKYLAGYWKINFPSFNVKLLPDEESPLCPSADTSLYNSCAAPDDSCMEDEYGEAGGCDEVDDFGTELLTISEVLVVKTVTSPLAKFRQEIEGLTDPDNQTIVVSVASCHFHYPPEVDVYEILSGEFLGVFKWLKVLHKRPKDDEIDKIHPDLRLSVKELSVEFQDDPFEVCLRDNFELLEDEYKEAEKRKDCLDARINEMRKNPMFQPTNIDELYRKLERRNTDMYVERALYLGRKKKRTSLLTLKVASIECMVFSDASMSGRNRLVEFMQQVDSESPWPEPDLQFSSAYFKWLRCQVKAVSLNLRDYPQPLADAKNLLLWGKCVIAEPAPVDRAIRTQTIDQGRPYYDDFQLKRSLLSYKIYHDLALDMDNACFAHGPCWEPTLSQFSIALSYVTGRSGDKDPSPALSWWDKLRYLMHGRLLFCLNKLKLLLHTTLDPYNTTEEVELTLTDANFDWTNAGILKCGVSNLSLYVRTLSKYDDCQLLHVPNLALTIQLDWICLGNPRDHHSVMPCAREKVPEHSLKGQHDSWISFRSQNVNVHINLETATSTGSSSRFSSAASSPELRPRLEMFSSTVRWMESLKWLFSGASRPIRRGTVFKNPQPVKQSFFRHFKKVRMSLGLHQLQFDYWTSASKTKGVLINIAKGISLSSEYSLKLVKVNDGLKHRPRSEWTIEYMNCNVGTSDVWFQSSIKVPQPEAEGEEGEGATLAGTDSSSSTGSLAGGRSNFSGGGRQIEKSFFISVENVQYNRDVAISYGRLGQPTDKKSPSHVLTVNGAKGAWTESNRDMAFALYDSWRRAHILRNQVSSEGFLKQVVIRTEENEPGESASQATASSATKRNSLDSNKKKTSLDHLLSEEQNSPSNSRHSRGELSLSTFVTAGWNTETTPMEKMVEVAGEGSGGGCVPIVYSEDQVQGENKKKDMEAMTACKKDDVLCRNWLIRFVNSQMLLKGTEARGHLIMSAAKAEILSSIHMPVWKDNNLLSKSSWSGSLESMQYFATVIPEDSVSRIFADRIMWLPRDKIEDQLQDTTPMLNSNPEAMPELVGSGQTAGGVVSQMVGGATRSDGPSTVSEGLQGKSGGLQSTASSGAADAWPADFSSAAATAQLQRIVSRCKCEFYYVAYGDKPIDEVVDAPDKVPKKPEETPWSTEKEKSLVNSFSLIHHDLNACTNSLQYTMILDVLNNLLLYMEPSIKSRTENYLRMKYQLKLSNLEDQRKPILTLQSQIRQKACELRAREKDIYATGYTGTLLNQEAAEGTAFHHGLQYLAKLEAEVIRLKEEINVKSEELDVRLRCYNEFQMASARNAERDSRRTAVSSRKRNGAISEDLDDDDKSEMLRRKSEIFFSRARWKLTEQDGQLGIGDVNISNFCYTKINLRDDSAQHTFEVGHIHVKNLLPGSLYEDIIYPTELKRDVPLDRHRVLRVYCAEKPPVGGISVKAHFEINLVPLTINITQNFYKKIMVFCFPEKAIQDEAALQKQKESKQEKKKKNKKSASFYVEMPTSSQLAIDDVEEMKARAQRNKLFEYIKIPEVPICVSYKGEKDKKKILDVTGFLLQVPPIEYHAVTWTWLDLWLNVKSKVKESLLAQAIKQKMGMKSHSMIQTARISGGSSGTLNSIVSAADLSFSGADDEEKAKLLLGMVQPKQAKGHKSGLRADKKKK